MASFFPSSPALIIFFILLLVLLHVDICESSKKGGGTSGNDGSKQFVDVDYLTLALNLEYLETEFFLCGVFGSGMDGSTDRNLAMGGLPPIGCTIVNNWVFPTFKDVITQFAYQEIGHLKAIKNQIGGSGFPRPLLNISATSFATIMDNAFSKNFNPPFDPYANPINYFIASYVIPYVGLTAYVGSAPNLQSPAVKQLVAGLLGVESGQDAVIRGLLYQFKDYPVFPYTYTVAEFTNKISTLRNNLGNKGTIKDEGLIVDPNLGAEGKTAGNVLAGDEHSLAYARQPDEVLSIVYGTGKPKTPGGFFPKGGDGKIAKSFR